MMNHEGRASAKQSSFDSELPRSPIRILPNELLADIFRRSVCPVADPIAPKWWSNLHTMVAANAPWTLTRVCRRWRGVAVETPALWSYITMNIIAPIPDSMGLMKLRWEKVLVPLKIMLQRSRNTPLHIQLYLDSRVEYYNKYSPQWPKFLGQLFHYSQRWKAICFPCCDGLMELLESSDVPLLEVVELNSDFSSSQYGRGFSILSDCPNLRHLHLASETPRRVAIPQKPWTNLVSHECAWVFEAHQLQLLQSMPRLARLQIGDSIWQYDRDQMWPIPETFVCKELSELHIDDSGAEVPNLILPNLEKLFLNNIPEYPESIVPMLIQSRHPLKQLTISRRLAPVLLRALLEAMPWLTTLNLLNEGEDGWVTPFIEHIAIVEPPPHRVCKQLQHLLVQPHPRHLPSFVKALSAALDARRTDLTGSTEAGFTPLERVIVQFDRDPGDDFMTLARPLLGGGVVRIQLSDARGITDLL